MSQVGSANSNWRGGKDLPCCICGKMVWRTPDKQRTYKRVCCGSTECKAAISAAMTREVGWFQGGPVDRACEQCGTNFKALRAEVNRGGGRFCSRKCVLESKKKRWAGKCEFCGKEFEAADNLKGIKRFCSRQCKKKSQIKIRTPEEITQRRLSNRIGTAMWESLKKNKHRRPWLSLVDYTLDDLRRHLESKFVDGMTWENMGQWHIDHRRPRSSFSYTKPEDAEFKECWSLANLQPLWAVENLRKGAKLLVA